MKWWAERAKRDHIILFGILALVGIGGGSLLRILTLAGRRAESANCAMNMKQVGLCARLWADKHGGLMPTNFICMSSEMIAPTVLHCRSDYERPSVTTWAEFLEQKSSYTMVSPGSKEGAVDVVFIRCRIHGHLAFADGSVMNASRAKVLRK